MGKILFLFCFVNALIAYFLLRGAGNKKNNLKLRVDALEEKINILSLQTAKQSRDKISLQEKINRYKALKNIIEEINQDLDIKSAAEELVNNASLLIAKTQGNCILYLVDKRPQCLSLIKVKSQDEALIIKAKEGDIFDAWVLRHMSPILIEDVLRDFRFDAGLRHLRPIASLIAAPLITNHRILGVLRLENPEPGAYSQDDLRLLVAISDLGAVALENSQLFDQTEDLAIHDSLTGFFTKGYFLQRLKEECDRSLRQDEPFSLLMVDIDYFKNYNDKFGHSAGDIVLQSLSLVIRAALGELGPIISRFGGEEFCIILPRADSKKARKASDELLSKIEHTKITLRRKVTYITVSIGIATFGHDASNDSELVFKADQAMYEAKKNGRNRVAEA